MAYFSNKPPPTPGEQLPMPHSTTAAIVKEPELKPSLKRKNVDKAEPGWYFCSDYQTFLLNRLVCNIYDLLC